MKQSVWNTEGHRSHEEVMPWKRFPHYWQYVRGTWITGGVPSPTKVMWSFDALTAVIIDLLLHKQPRWLESPWHSGGVFLTVVVFDASVTNRCNNSVTNRELLWRTHRKLQNRQRTDDILLVSWQKFHTGNIQYLVYDNKCHRLYTMETIRLSYGWYHRSFIMTQITSISTMYSTAFSG